ncbi:MAG TPA: hypothetical protein VMU18_12665, partial [Rhodoblastus sp.]|nr:hypothetical protein [Rhodoblastus sp.]
ALGFAVGFPVETISPFVESMFSDGLFAGRAVPFVKPGHRAMTDYLRSWGAECREFHPELYPTPHLFLARWIAYREFFARSVDAEGRAFRNVMISDVRDATFQKPLFAKPAAALEFHCEAPSPRLGECPINSRWIVDCLGPEEFEFLGPERILCAGTVSGSLAGLRAYVETTTGLAQNLPSERARSGADQTVHNHIFYRHLIAHSARCENFERVATLHYVDGALLRADHRGRVVNPDGSISEMAHQSDRHPRLAATIERVGEKRRARSAKIFRRPWRRLANRLRRAVGKTP